VWIAFLVEPHQDRVALLPEVGGDAVAVAHQRQFLPEARNGRDGFGDEVLMGCANDRELKAEPVSDLIGVGAGCNHHYLALHVALFRLNDPLAALRAAHAGDEGVSGDLGAQLPGAFREGERRTGGIDVTVGRRVQGGSDPSRLIEWMQRRDLLRANDLHRVAEGPANAQDLAQIVVLVVGVGEPQAAAPVPRHRLSRLGLEPLVKLDAIAGDARQAGIAERMRDGAGRVPGRAGGEFRLLDQEAVGPALVSEVVEQRAADDTAADDHDLPVGWQHDARTRRWKMLQPEPAGSVLSPRQRL
jgi:hypothetical protein